MVYGPDCRVAGRTIPRADPLHLDVAAVSHRQWLVRRLPAGDLVRHRRGHRQHLQRTVVPHRGGLDHRRDRQPVPARDEENRPRQTERAFYTRPCTGRVGHDADQTTASRWRWRRSCRRSPCHVRRRGADARRVLPGRADPFGVHLAERQVAGHDRDRRRQGLRRGQGPHLASTRDSGARAQ